MGCPRLHLKGFSRGIGTTGDPRMIDTKQPHETFRSARQYVESYLEQVSRLLQDLTNLMQDADPAWNSVTPSRYVGEMKESVGNVSDWMPNYFYAFFETTRDETEAAVKFIAFIGAALGPLAADELPELNIGWAQTTDRELTARTLYGFLDPAAIEESSARELASSIATLKWELPKPHKDNDELRISLRRVPLSLFASPADVQLLFTRFQRELP